MLSNRPRWYTGGAHNFGRGLTATTEQVSFARIFSVLAPRPCERLHDRPCNEQRDDGDDLADEDGAIQVERRPPGGLAVLDHPGSGGAGAHPKTGAAVPGGVPAAAPASGDVGRGNDRQPVLLVRLALDPAHL